MALTKEALTLLISLQERDLVFDRLQKELARVPLEIQAMRDGLEREKARQQDAKQITIELEKAKKGKELDLAQKEEAVRKHMMELNQVKTNEAFKALQTEIDRAKAAGGQIETEILEIMERLDASRKGEKAAVVAFRAREEGVKGDVAAMETLRTRLQAEFEAAKTAREAAAEGIDAGALRAYRHIRSRGKSDAIVRIDGNACGACRMAQSPHKIVEATRATTMVLCESCQRILYIPAALAKAAAAVATPAPEAPAA